MDEGLPTPITRPRAGRWLGGVCAGLARRWEVPPGTVRLWFALGSVLLGLGVLVYVAAWLIFPAESEDGRGQRGIVSAGPGLRRADRPRGPGEAPAPWRRCSASAG